MNQENVPPKSAPAAKSVSGTKRWRLILLLVLVSLALLVALEFMTDFVEIGLGEIVQWSNAIRPQKGPVWQRENHDKLATSTLATIIEEEPVVETQLTHISRLNDIVFALETQPLIRISKTDFIRAYSQLQYATAQKIMSPYDLLLLIENIEWRSCQISKTESDLQFYFLDGENQLLTDAYLSLEASRSARHIEAPRGTILDEIDEFHGRAVSGEQFLTAFNNLEMRTKIYLMNDPMQLIRWGDSLQKVAVSKYVIDGAVTIAFQIDTGVTSTITRYQASERAATRLLSEFNKILPDKYLAMPERK